MELGNKLRLDLRTELVAILEQIGENEGVPKEDVARQALEVWVEQYCKYGPAFSRRRQIITA
jgi:hypothetical protein